MALPILSLALDTTQQSGIVSSEGVTANERLAHIHTAISIVSVLARVTVARSLETLLTRQLNPRVWRGCDSCRDHMKRLAWI